jgi:hypothetical protein
MQTSQDPSLLVYSEAKTEYTKQLCQFIVPAILKFSINLLEKAKEMSKGEQKKILYNFQILLNEIPDWNKEKCISEIQLIQSWIQCEYLEDLITAVFIAHTKILSSISINSKHKNVQIRIPDIEHVLFKIIIEVSKLYWKSTFLFRDDITNIEKQQNYRQIEVLIQDGIQQAIRLMVPVKNILKNCIIQNDSGETDNDDTETSVESVKQEAHVDTLEPLKEEPVIGESTKEESLNTNTITLDNMLVPIIPTHDDDRNSITYEPSDNKEPPVIVNVEEEKSSKVQFTDHESVFNEDEYDDDVNEHELEILDEPPSELDGFEDLEATSPVNEELGDGDFDEF